MADVERVPLGGTDPGADYSGAATLASARLSRVALGGYSPDDVEDLRRRSLNTIAYLEAQVEALQVQAQSLRALLDASGPEALGRGLVHLAKKVRSSLDGQGLALAWAGAELAAIVSAPEDVSEERARAFPARLAELVNGPRPAGIGTGDARVPGARPAQRESKVGAGQ